MTRFLSILIFIFSLSCTSKNENTPENEAKKPVIAVVNYPLYYFVKSIGGDHITVYFPSIEGDPAYWKPSSKQVINFQNADLIIANGAGYAKWMGKVSLPSSKIVNTSISFEDQWIEANEGLAHSHGPQGEHVHKETVSTTWLNFKFATKQAESIHSALVDLLPGHSQALNENFEQLQKNLGDLDKRMEEIANSIRDRQVIASHPVYQYLESGYGLKIISKHWEPDEMPNDDQWNGLKETIKDHPLGIMIWEDEPLEETKSMLNDLNVLVAVFNPCANTPETGDFMGIMNENLQQLKQAINAKNHQESALVNPI